MLSLTIKGVYPLFLGPELLRTPPLRKSMLVVAHKSYSQKSNLMKAVCINQFGGANVLKVQEVPMPIPTSSEALVKVHAAGINPVDTYIREGEFMVLPKLPAILGKEIAGVVEQIGTDIKNFKVGDRVVCCLPFDGGYAEYVTCKEENMFHLKKNLSFSQGAGLYVAYFTAYRALVTKGKIKKGELLLVHGASGAVGIAAVQIGKARGLTVVGTAGTQEGMDIVKSVGADHVFNHRGKGYSLHTFASTAANGFDMILENSAHINLAKDLLFLNQNGRIAVVGSRGPIEINPRSLIYTEGQIFGVKLLGVTPAEFKETISKINEGIEEGWLNPVIAEEYHMKLAKKAHEDLMSDRGARGKLVFKME